MNPAFTLRPEEEQALDAYIAAQPEPRPTRADVLREALQAWLQANGLSSDGEEGFLRPDELSAENDD